MDIAGDRSWPEGGGSELLQIAVGTFGILALELALIRWMAGQIRIFAAGDGLVSGTRRCPCWPWCASPSPSPIASASRG